jgi:hypothetical protein
MLQDVKYEPVMIGQAITALVGVGSAFGLHLTAEQVSAIVVVLNLVIGLIVRSKVSPTNR